MKKIAIPTNQNGHIENHFGRCSFYEIYATDEANKIVEVKTLASTQGCGCKSNIASELAENGVSIMLAGGIGQGAINKLQNANIEVIKGCSGTTKEIISQYLKGDVSDSGSACNHQKHHDHQCSH